jgi:hypothetical protein
MHRGAVIRAAVMKRDQPQLENEVNVPEWLADEAVVL